MGSPPYQLCEDVLQRKAVQLSLWRGRLVLKEKIYEG